MAVVAFLVLSALFCLALTRSHRPPAHSDLARRARQPRTDAPNPASTWTDWDPVHPPIRHPSITHPSRWRDQPTDVENWWKQQESQPTPPGRALPGPAGTVEGQLVEDLLTGVITAAEYQVAMASLAAQADVEHPLAIPPELA